MRALIVDDEAMARLDLRCHLEQLEIEIVGEAECAEQAIAMLPVCSPDVVFLDISMPVTSGLELAKYLADYAVVFVTAHEEFAVQAFSVDACDYVLKPVTLERLRMALKRATRRVDLAERNPEHSSPRLRVRERDRTYWIDALRVESFSAQNKYVVFAIDGVEHLLRDSLDDLAERLEPHGFVRIHRAHLVHAAAIASYDEATVTLKSGGVLPLARRQRALVKTLHSS